VAAPRAKLRFFRRPGEGHVTRSMRRPSCGTSASSELGFVSQPPLHKIVPQDWPATAAVRPLHDHQTLYCPKGQYRQRAIRKKIEGDVVAGGSDHARHRQSDTHHSYYR